MILAVRAGGSIIADIRDGDTYDVLFPPLQVQEDGAEPDSGRGTGGYDAGPQGSDGGVAPAPNPGRQPDAVQAQDPEHAPKIRDLQDHGWKLPPRRKQPSRYVLVFDFKHPAR